MTLSSEIRPKLKEVSLGVEGTSCMGGVWRSDQRNTKLELPMFNGDNPYGWIFGAERCFSINQMEEVEKLEATTCV